MLSRVTELKVVDIEKVTRVPKKFRFPYFTKYHDFLVYSSPQLTRPNLRLCWYVADKYLRDIKSKEEFSPRVLESLEGLCSYLVSEVRAMERGSEAAKRDAKEHVPTDRIKDAPALARELRWRVRLAAGTTSDDEDHGRPAKKALTNGNVNMNGGVKRKRSPFEVPASESPLERVQFRNFQPKGWDVVENLPKEEETATVPAVYPEEVGWQQRWIQWDDEAVGGDAGRQALVERQREVTIKARKVDGGLERQRIERIFEKWAWSGVSDEDVMEKGDVEMKLEDDDSSHVDSHIDDQKEGVVKESQEAESDGMVLVD